jgi:hypothetical protein
MVGSPEMANPYFPFHSIGLQCNPFRTLTEEEWSELVILPTDWVSLLEERERHIQIIGDAGWGKSSMLRGFQRWCREQGIDTGFEYLPLGADTLQSNIHEFDVFLLDEAQRLCREEFRRFLFAGDAGTRLIWTSHEDMVDSAVPSRMRIQSVHLSGYPTNDLATILNARLDAFTLESSPRIEFAQGALELLEKRYGPNLRGMFDFLYEFFQTLPGMKSISAEALEGFEQSSESPIPSG